MIKVRIPATSANIGSGFDALGLAVNLYNYVFMEEQDGLSIEAIDRVPIPTGEDNLVYRAARELYAICGAPFRGLRILQENNIPLARGLGSSSACIIGGLFGANALLGNPLPRDEIVNLAAVMEGHPDNSTPGILGGLVTAVIDGKKVYYVKQEISGHLRFVTFIPDFELKTELARSVLPGEIPRQDGVFNLSRAALMSVSLYSGNYQNLRVAAQDRLHQPYRLELIPHAREVFDLCYSLGAYGVYISGAGSTIMAIVDEKNHSFFDRAEQGVEQLGLTGWQLKQLAIDNQGTLVF